LDEGSTGGKNNNENQNASRKCKKEVKGEAESKGRAIRKWNMECSLLKSTEHIRSSENLEAEIQDHPPHQGSSSCNIRHGLALCFTGGPGGAEQISVFPGL
jgi:hypothetical protein